MPKGIEVLSGIRVVVTGDFRSMGFDRNAMNTLLAGHGAAIDHSPTKWTTILICGERPGKAKVAAATIHGIDIWNMDDFKEYLYPTLVDAIERVEPVKPKVVVISELPEHYGDW